MLLGRIRRSVIAAQPSTLNSEKQIAHQRI